MLASASRRRRRVAVDIPPATPPMITTFRGKQLFSGASGSVMASRPHLRANQGLGLAAFGSDALADPQ